MTDSIRAAYEKYTARGYYERFGRDYRNPHEAAIRAVLHAGFERWQPDLHQVLDLACGSGEVTLALRDLRRGEVQIEGVDPFTGEAYFERTGQRALAFSFEQIAAGILSGRSYTLIVCSFALHLLPASRLPALAYQLSWLGEGLIVISPHKRPTLRPEWGWRLVDHILVDRVRARLYRSENKSSSSDAERTYTLSI